VEREASTVEQVRPGLIVAVSVAAVLGGAAALLVGKGAGWVGDDGSTTVVVRETTPPTTAPAPAVGPAPAAAGFQATRIYRARSGGVVTIYSYFDNASSSQPVASQGSGFVVSKDGLVLTSAHVITDAGTSPDDIATARDVYIQFADGDRVTAKIVGYDPFDDVGVLRVDPSDHDVNPVPLGNSSAVVVGEPVAAIGSPFDNQSSLSVGVVSATRRAIDSLTSQYSIVDAIQTDAPINHGNSGGPLFNARGQVIGINAQIRSEDSGSGFEGVGFAVPINSAKRSLRQLVDTGRVAYAFVGISTQDLTPSIARRFGYPVARGALVNQVQSGSPAADAGLVAGKDDVRLNGELVRPGGDVVVAIDGQAVRGSSDVIRIVSALAPGRTAAFAIVKKNGDRKTVDLKLVARPG
jgi:2-alkenal reductase